MYQSTHTGAQVDEAVDKVLASPISMMSNRNLLDNWYFVGGGSQQGGGQFPINQRGQTSYIGVGYGIDRWYTNAGGTFAQIVNSGYMTFKVYNQYAGMVQFVEEPRIIDGQTYTLSVLTASGCYSWTFAASKSTGRASPIGWYGVEKMYSYVDFYSNGAWRIFVFDSASDNTEKTVDVIATKLELGSIQTLAHQEGGVWVLNEIPNYGQELAKCQRYFVKISGQSGTYCRFGTANAYSATIAMGEIPLPVTMRAATPTLSFGNIKLQTGQTSIDVSSIAFRGLCPNILYVDLGVASGLTTGAMYLIKADHASGSTVVNDGYLTISCDL